MKPTLCKLALLMSTAGLGLSIADAAGATIASKGSSGTSGRRHAVVQPRSLTLQPLSAALKRGAFSAPERGSAGTDGKARAREEFARVGFEPASLVERVAFSTTEAVNEDDGRVALAMVEIAEAAYLWPLQSRRGLPPDDEPQKPSLTAIELRAPRPRTPMPEALEWTRSPLPGSDDDQQAGGVAYATGPDEATQPAFIDEGGAPGDADSSGAMPARGIVWIPAPDDEPVMTSRPAVPTADVEAPGVGLSCAAPSTVAAAVTLVMVASHEDRVLHSLAALLAGDDPSRGRFGAQAPQPMVATHAEKALLHLAAIHERRADKRERHRVRAAAGPVAAALPKATLASPAPVFQASPVLEAAEATTAPVIPRPPATLPELAAVALDPTVTFMAPKTDILLDMPATPTPPMTALAVDIDLRSTPSSEPLDIDLGIRSVAPMSAAVDIDLLLDGAQDPVALAPRAGEPFNAKDVHAVSTADLDRVRGGFSTTSGLQVSFGIERAVYVNGVLVTTTSLSVSGLGTANPTIANGSAGQVALVQNGAGNTFLSGPLNAATAATIVQNTLNDQRIQSITQINATVNSLQIVRSMNLGASMRGAIIDSLRR